MLWVSVITVCGVESSPSSDYPPGLESISSLLTVNSLGHFINQRSTDDQTFKPLTSKVKKDIDSLNQNKSALLSEQNEDGDAVGSNEKNKSYEVNRDEGKSKHSKQQKTYLISKTHSNSKIPSNESNIEKQKPNLFVSQEFKSNNSKKELKLSPDINDQIIKSNHTNLALPGSYKLENRKTPQLTEFGTTTFATVSPGDIKINETHVMSDQPIDTVHNATDLSDDDSSDLFSDNTSKLFQLMLIYKNFFGITIIYGERQTTVRDGIAIVMSLIKIPI